MLRLLASSFLAITALVSPRIVETMGQRGAALADQIRREVHSEAPSAEGEKLSRALAALASIPRGAFVPPEYRNVAYDAHFSEPIGHGQTASAPYAVALMVAAANVPPRGSVLDIGTGSGYQAAVLSKLAAHVTSIEIVPSLAISARKRLARLGFSNVEVRIGDGFVGAANRAPFDAIIVAAGSDKVPQPLLDQLKLGGRIIMPIGPSWASEQIVVMTKTSSTAFERCSLGWAVFVPLTGKGQRPRDSGGLFDSTIPLCYGTPVVSPTFIRTTSSNR